MVALGHREPLARLDTEPLVGRLEPLTARLDTGPRAARLYTGPRAARLYTDHGMQSSAACKLSRAAELATGSGYGSPYSFEVASKAAVADPAKAAAIKVYLATLDKAYVWAATHPSAWAVAWSNASGLPASVMNAAAKVDATTPVQVTSGTISSEQNLVNQFFAAGLIPAKVDISDYITTEFNSTVGGSS